MQFDIGCSVNYRIYNLSNVLGSAFKYLGKFQYQLLNYLKLEIKFNGSKFQQTKMDWNRQKWIRFIRVKSRFWSFESISILIKISEFFRIHYNLYEEIKTKRFLFFSIQKNMQTINSFYHAGLKQNDFYFFKSNKKLLGSYNSSIT